MRDIDMNEFEKYLKEHHIESIGTPPPDLRKVFPEGAMMFNVTYRRHPEEFEVVYLDPATNRLEVAYIPAIVDIWFTKPEFRYTMKDSCIEPYFKDKMRYQHKDDDAYQIPQIELDKTYRVWCKVSQIPKMIYQHAGKAKMYSEDGSHLIDTTYAEFYEENMGSAYTFGTFTKRMCQNPWSFKCDFQPDVYFRDRWVHEFGDACDTSKVTAAFLDIEIDVLDVNIDLKNPKDNRAHVSMVTSIFPKDKMVYVDILEPRPLNDFAQHLHEKVIPLRNKMVKEYEWIKSHQKEFIDMILGHESTSNCPVRIDEDMENLKYLQGYTVNLGLFEQREGRPFIEAEARLIDNVFAHVNLHRPMFMFAWNAPFDINYLPNRLQYIGYDPGSSVVPENFKSKEIRYEPDKTNNFSMKNSRDWFYIASYTQYLCQERLYAGIRQSQSEEPSYQLTAIGKKVAKIEKLTDTKSGKFSEFLYTDFIKFVLYNVRDVVIQLAIETKVSDAKTLYARSYDFVTAFSKCFQETHIVRNSKANLYEVFGYVMANKVVVDKTIDGAFQGAYVADPLKNSVTMVMSGRGMNCIIYGSADLDATAMYPSQKMAYNLGKMTLIYKCRIDNNLFRNKVCRNLSYNQKYTWKDSDKNEHETDLSGPLFNSFKNHNVCSLMHNWFNAPTVTELIAHTHKVLTY